MAKRKNIGKAKTRVARLMRQHASPAAFWSYIARLRAAGL